MELRRCRISSRIARWMSLWVVLGFLFPAGRTTLAVSFVRSDANQDGSTDIADAVYTLLYLFAGEAKEIACLDAADSNDSGAVDISDAVYTLGYLFLGGPPPAAPFPECAEDPTEDELGCLAFRGADCPPLGPPSGRLVSAVGCKEEDRAGLGKISNAEDCIEWSFAEDGVLRLRHINACFNCCAKPAAKVRIDGSLIEIAESESYDPAPCRCLCLFDLEIEIVNLPPGEYTIQVDEVCGPGMKFQASLAPGTGDIYCEKRGVYPWGA